MKVAIGIFGFIRENIYDNEWLKFFEMFKDKDLKIDIYVCTPNILHEFENDVVNFEYIKDTLLKNPIIENVFIKDYKYDPQVFINKSKELNLVCKTSDNLYPYRIISLFSSISNVSKEILNSNIEYDFYILTRFDMLKLIYSIGTDYEIYKEKSSIYGYSVLHNFIEDRIIITGELGLTKLSNLYETYHTIENIRNTQFISEHILRTYLLQFTPELNIYYNRNVSIGTGNIHIKYTSEFETKINNIYAQEPDAFIS